MMTQSQSAPITVSKDLETSMSTPIRAQPPMSVPMTMINVGQLTRRGSTSFGTSIDLASGGALTDILQEPALASQAPAERGVEPGAVQMPEGACQHLRRQAPGRGAGGSFGADHHGRRGHGASQVAIELIRRRVRRGVAEVRQRRRSPRPGRPAARHR